MNSAVIFGLSLANAGLAASLGYWIGRAVHRTAASVTPQDEEHDSARDLLQEFEADVMSASEDCSLAIRELEDAEKQPSQPLAADPQGAVVRLLRSSRMFERRLAGSQTHVSRLAQKFGGVWTNFAHRVSEHQDHVAEFRTVLERELSKQAQDSPVSAQSLLMTIRGLADRNQQLRQELDHVQRELADRESRWLAAHRDARIDSLTRLPNRRAFEERLSACQTRAEQLQEKYSLVLLDLDKFKEINDRFGHPFGDAMLAVFGRILSDAIRTSDLAARYGGEEFVILLPGAGAGSATAVAERCRQQAEKSVVRNGDVAEPFTVSGGVAAWEPGMTAADVLEAADQALYAAKAEGRNRIRQATELDAERKALVSVSDA